MAPLPLDLVSTVLTSTDDAFFACRCALVCKGWRDVLADEAFWRAWAALVGVTEQDRADLVDEGWCNTRMGIYPGPLRKSPDDPSPQSDAELAFQCTYKCLVIGWSTLRRNNLEIVQRWRFGFEFTKFSLGSSRAPTPSRRSTRSVLPAGGVVAPAPASFADMVAWRREIERLSGWAMTRADVEVIGRLGGSERWHKEAGLALRLFTPDEILTFLESRGREPKDVGSLFGQVRPLRTDDAEFPAPLAWPCTKEKFWLPIGDFRHSEEASPRSRPELDWAPDVSHLVVMCFDPNAVASLCYVTSRWDEDACMAPFISLSHFLDIMADIVHDPTYVLTCDMIDSDDDGSDDHDSDDDDEAFQNWYMTHGPGSATGGLWIAES